MTQTIFNIRLITITSDERLLTLFHLAYFSHKIILSLKMPSAKVAAKKKADEKAKAKLGVKKTVKTKKVSKKVEKKKVKTIAKKEKTKKPSGAKPKSAPKKKVKVQIMNRRGIFSISFDFASSDNIFL